MSCPRPRPRAMSKSDTWPGGVAMESLSNMDSAGSCDSVISVNSGYSEDSMEHLSAEERACLMYLEETIEALEVQEDSGLSNDEPDPGLQAGKMGWLRVNDISSLKSDESGGEQKSDEAEHHAPNPTSEPRFSPAANTTDLQTSVDLMTQPQPPATESLAGDKIHSSATKTGLLFLSKDGDGKLKILSSRDLLRPDPPSNASEIDVGLIPPPSDFMDEPDRPPQPEKRTEIDLKQLQQRASAKRTSVSSTVTPEPPNRPPELNPLTIHSGPLMSPPPEAAEPRSPPVVAPKPKKLPANIILKSHKATIADGNGGHSVPASSDRLLLDPQRVHIEALRKLGLLKSDEAESDPALSPKHSPKSTRSWAAPRSPISPKAPHTPPPTASYTGVNSPSPASVLLQPPVAESPSGTPTAPAVPPPDILPAPTAFSDPGGHVLSDNELSLDATANAQVNTPPRAPPAMAHHLTPPRVKSATLERSGLGLGSYIASQDLNEGKQSPGQLRNNRPRPASLGSGKEFSSAQGGDSQAGRATSKEPDLRRSLPAFQHAGDSQKLPRSQGISVLICPRAENEDNRRKALKRLGLLRD